MHTLMFHRTHLVRIVLLGLALTFGGCSTPRGLESSAAGGDTMTSPSTVTTFYLPKQLIDIQVERVASASSGGEMEDRFTLRLLPPMPDPRKRATVRSGLGEKYTIRTTDDGLLTSSTAPAAAPAPQQLGTVVARFPAASKPAAPSRACSDVDGLWMASALQMRPFKVTVIFDPTIPADLARVEGELCSLGAHYRFVLREVGKPSPHVITSTPDGFDPTRRAVGGGTDARTVYYGLMYRRPQPYVFAIYEQEEGTDTLRFVSSVPVSLPNLAPIEVVDKPDMYIKIRDALAFQNGMVTARSEAPVPRHRGFRMQFESGSEKKRAEANGTTPAHASPTKAP